MILRKFYVLWSDQPKQAVRLKHPGPFLLVDWPMSADVGAQELVILGSREDQDRSTLVVGRTEGSGLSIDECGVSKRHALLRRVGLKPGDPWIISDLGSTNGTWVGGQRLETSETHQLKDRERLTFGTDVHALYLEIDSLYTLMSQISRHTRRYTELGAMFGEKITTSAVKKPGNHVGPPPAVGAKLDAGVEYVIQSEGFAPVIISPAYPCIVGRSEDAGLRLDHPQVSRRHALIEFNSGVLEIHDLGGANGTILWNGYQLASESSPLDADQSFWIGPFKLQVSTETHSQVSAELKYAARASLMVPQDAKVVFTGSVESMPLAEVFQGIDFNRRTGTLTVVGDVGAGRVVVIEGAPKFAEVADKKNRNVGREAIFRLLETKDGLFTFMTKVDFPELNIDARFPALLLAWSSQQDEGMRQEPPPDFWGTVESAAEGPESSGEPAGEEE